MRVTIVPADSLFIVDNSAQNITSYIPLAIHVGLHALQWNGESGHLEWQDSAKPNTQLMASDYDTHVKPYVDQFNAYVANKEATEKAKYNSEEARFERLRTKRDAKLRDTDYLMMADYPITDECRTQYCIYRQALRDITSLEGAPWDGGDDGVTVPWPAEPEVVKEI